MTGFAFAWRKAARKAISSSPRNEDACEAAVSLRAETIRVATSPMGGKRRDLQIERSQVGWRRSDQLLLKKGRQSV